MVYDPASLATSALQQVRWLLGGSKADDLVVDDEIEFSLSLNGDNIYLAAAECADIIGSQFAATSQRVSVGPFQSSDWQLTTAWDKLAKHLRRLGMRYSGIDASQMLPGMSASDILDMDSQTEYPQFSFAKGIHDNPDVNVDTSETGE
jgi:hypothetical protein